MELCKPIFVVDILPELDNLLINMLRTLKTSDWAKQTIAPGWSVKDVAVHLLDGNIRTLSMARDGYFGGEAESVSSYKELVTFLNKINADWVRAFQRVSPAVLINLLEITGKQYCSYLKTLDPFKPAIFSVDWAGESKSDNWFHIAREYTEKWHHQQQIRLVFEQEKPLLSNKYYYPHLDTSMRALPHHYRNIEAREGTVIHFGVTGISNRGWYLWRNSGKWELLSECDFQPNCSVIIEDTVAWRLFTKGIDKSQARSQMRIQGSIELGEKILDMLAVMAD